MVLPLVLFACSAAVSFGLTAVVRRYAIQRAILDVPNARSMHDAPVPRGGGLAIVITLMLGLPLLTAFAGVPAAWTIALVGGGLPIAVVGWLDDRRGVRRRIRALVHFAAAAWALSWLGGLPALSVGGTLVPLPFVGTLLAAIGIAWSINLYNFMDGIDGIAGTQAVTVGAAAAVLMILAGATSAALPVLLVAGAAAGFLALNWSPARIFMGDVGSAFLGFVFATLAIASEVAGALPLLVWLVLSAVFLFDATVTLLRRVLRGERWYEAHRSHCYQRLVTRGLSHQTVVGGVVGLNALLGLVGWYLIRGGSPAFAVAAVVAGLGAICIRVERLQPMPLPPGARHAQDTTPRTAADR